MYLHYIISAMIHDTDTTKVSNPYMELLRFPKRN